MATTLYTAPAAGGKTAYLVVRARALAQDPVAAPRVIVPTRLQAQAWRTRLARAGGALGIRVGTFDDVYRDVLRLADATAGTVGVITQLADPVHVRVLRSVIASAPLVHYDAIRRMPGFVQAVRDLIGELKAGGVFPEALLAAVATMGAPPRLMELARVYEAYQLRLQAEDWADYAGVGWLAAEALDHNPAVAANWPCVMVDGFDDLTTVQLQVLSALASRVKEMVVTLTGADASSGPDRDLVHKRFLHTCRRLEESLSVSAQPLPVQNTRQDVASPLRHLERTLYTHRQLPRVPSADVVAMVAVPDRETEVRTALRWLKSAMVPRGDGSGIRPGEAALLARDLTPYRDVIDQVAAEYGVPVQIASGYALRSNPATAALLDLLQLAAPGEDHLAWRPTVAAWRSPYFDWAGTGGGLTWDAHALDSVARWGSVIGGEAQWAETFDLLRRAGSFGESRDEEGPEASGAVPTGDAAATLADTFAHFCRRIAPLPGSHLYREHVAWLESLIGNVSTPVDSDELDSEEAATSLGVARRAASGNPALADRDLAALNAFKDLLRGLVWAEAAVDGAPVTYETFLEELLGAVDAASYRTPLATGADAVLAADVSQARGISFRRVAVLGLAEGEFPTTLSEDPFLRNADRQRLRTDFGLAIDDSAESLEAQHFYEAVTRPTEALLLTRPRIADNGAPWQPSPFWEEVIRRLDVKPQMLTSASRPDPFEAASWSELLQSVASQPANVDAWAWVHSHAPATAMQMDRAARVLVQRLADQGPAFRDNATAGEFDGDLMPWHAIFTERFAPHRVWSASRLESYRRCGFLFFVGNVLGLEPRQAPAEGLDARQLGNIYHHILEALYRDAGEGAGLATLLAALPDVARPILDAAPRQEQFRATAWWAQTRQEILGNVQRSVEAIETLDDGFAFHQAERTFGIPNREGPSLTVADDGGDSFRVRGFIDRVDRDDAGNVRIVDYKTAGPWGYNNSAVRSGEKLQLPLYALAAQAALRLGEVTEGFYWHVRQAEPSSFRLSRFRGEAGDGPSAAIATVTALAWEAVRGARRGRFVPVTPRGGCPSYCPAAAFCWHYEASRW